MNVMTEDEARKKWCPHARALFSSHTEAKGVVLSRAMAAGNRGPNHETPCLLPDAHVRARCECIASACMAWRWGDIDGDRAFVGTPIPRFGYCGLAGSPSP